LGLLFREPLTSLVARINNIKTPGFELAAPHASAQLTEKTPEPPEALRGEIVSVPAKAAVTSTVAITGDALAARREAVRNLGKGFALIDEDVETIKGQLVTMDMPLDSEDTAQILVRHLATTQLMLRCERTHRLIFGSQIAALHLMNMQGPQPESAIKLICEGARTKETQFYGSYNFENWIRFLIDELTVRCDDSLYAITVYGRSYLEYIGVFSPAPKPH